MTSGSQGQVTDGTVRWFAVMLAVFFGALGGLVLWDAKPLGIASIVLGSAWLIGIILNRAGGRAQWLGILLPGLFAALSWPVTHGGVDAMTVAAAAWGVGGLVTLLSLVPVGVGRQVYFGWMRAAEPIGWTLTHVVLGIVYYGVITPIGLIMQWGGRDPLRKKRDSSAGSYWIEHSTASEAGRYFRQF